MNMFVLLVMGSNALPDREFSQRTIVNQFKRAHKSVGDGMPTGNINSIVIWVETLLLASHGGLFWAINECSNDEMQNIHSAGQSSVLPDGEFSHRTIVNQVKCAHKVVGDDRHTGNNNSIVIWVVTNMHESLGGLKQAINVCSNGDEMLDIYDAGQRSVLPDGESSQRTIANHLKCTSRQEVGDGMLTGNINSIVIWEIKNVLASLGGLKQAIKECSNGYAMQNIYDTGQKEFSQSTIVNQLKCASRKVVGDGMLTGIYNEVQSIRGAGQRSVLPDWEFPQRTVANHFMRAHNVAGDGMLTCNINSIVIWVVTNMFESFGGLKLAINVCSNCDEMRNIHGAGQRGVLPVGEFSQRTVANQLMRAHNVAGDGMLSGNINSIVIWVVTNMLESLGGLKQAINVCSNGDEMKNIQRAGQKEFSQRTTGNQFKRAHKVVGDGMLTGDTNSFVMWEVTNVLASLGGLKQATIECSNDDEVQNIHNGAGQRTGKESQTTFTTSESQTTFTTFSFT